MRPHSWCRRPALEVLEERTVLSGTWTPLANPLPGGDGAQMGLLLSDGSVLVHGGGYYASNAWYRLTPDSSGSYVHGTWTPLASMALERLDYPAAVLPDGRVLVMGGEYTGINTDPTETNTGEIYDPLKDQWTPIAAFPQSEFGDDPLAVLPDGRVLAGYIGGPQTYIYDPAANAWTRTGDKLYNDFSSEESWVKLSDDSILTYDVFATPGTHAQRYLPATGKWVDAGTLPQTLSGAAFGWELGPALRLPDGRALFLGANNNTAYCNPASNTWTQGPALPGGLGAGDEPAALLPNGHVLLAVTDTHYFKGLGGLYELDPTTNTYTNVTPAAGVIDLAESGFAYNTLLLPTGQVLLFNRSSEIDVYTPAGSPDPSWRPTITGISAGGGTFTLTGTQLNGLSDGAAYGDDNEMASNYPIVRLVDGSGNVHFARTFNWSSTGVATGSTPVSTQFTLPAGPATAADLLSVSANGVSSAAVLFVTIAAGDSLTLRLDPKDSTQVQVLQGGTVTAKFAAGSFSAIDVLGSGGTLVVDESGGGIAAPISFSGNGSDTLSVTGKPFSNATFSAGDAQSGSVVLDGHTIRYSNLAAVDSTATVANLVFTGASGSNPVSFATAGGRTTATCPGGATTTFTNPTALLTLQAGAAGISLAGSFQTAGNVTFSGPVVLGSDASITSGGDITFLGPVDAGTTAGQGLTLSAGGNVSLAAVGTSTPLASFTIAQALNVTLAGAVVSAGDVGLSAAGNVTLASPASVMVLGSTGALTVTAGGNVTLQHPTSGNTPFLSTGGGGLSVTTGAGGTFSADSGSAVAVSSSGGAVTISADSIVLHKGINAGAGTVTLQQAGTAARPISLGSVVAGSLGLDDGQLDRVSAAGLILGRADNPGDLTLTGPITQANSGYASLLLRTGGNVRDGSPVETPTLTVSALTIQAGGAIGATGSGDVNVSAATLAASSGGAVGDDIFLQDAVNVSLGPISAGAGNVTLQGASLDGTSGAGVTAASLTVFATGGFGGNTPVATAVGTFAATVAGGVNLSNSGSLTIGPVQALGAIVLSASGSVTLPAGVTLQTPLTLTLEAGTDGGGAAVTLAGTLQAASATVNGGSGADTFALTPSAATPITVTGGDPKPPAAPGDVLSLSLAGLATPTLNLAAQSDGYLGTYSFGAAARSITFSQIERVADAADLALTQAVSSGATEGRTVTFTITVLNLGPAAATNVVLTDAVPAGTVFVAGSSTAGYNPATGQLVLGTLPAGASVRVTFVVRPLEEGTIGNTAGVSSAAPDPAPGNNSVTLSGLKVADPPITGKGGLTLKAVEGSDSGVQTLATFTDPGGSGDTRYVATIRWGDGTSSTATPGNGGIVATGLGFFTVRASHAYLASGTRAISVSIQHGSLGAVTVSDTAAVSGDVALAGTAGKDSLSIARTAGGPVGSITCVLNGVTMKLTGVHSLTFSGQGGNDSVTIDCSGGVPLFAGDVHVDGGSGSDTLIVNAAGGTVSTGSGTLLVRSPGSGTGRQNIVYASVETTRIQNAGSPRRPGRAAWQIIRER